MYLIVTQHKTEQVETLRSDSIFYGWIIDNNVGVFRCQNNAFEQLKVVQKQREYSKVLFYSGEWVPVINNQNSKSAFKPMIA
jgi:hypothetical protein